MKQDMKQDMTPDMTTKTLPQDMKTRYGVKESRTQKGRFLLCTWRECGWNGVRSARSVLRYAAMIVVMLVVGVNSAWGQGTPSGTDRSGYYYIPNYKEYGRLPDNNSGSETSGKYYLCPSTSMYAADKPFVTDYMTDKVTNSIWKIEYVSTSGGVDYYHIKHHSSGKYMKTNEQLVSGNPDRVRVHLETATTTDFANDTNGDFLFFFYTNNKTPAAALNVGALNICPKTLAIRDKGASLAPAKGNKNSYAGIDQGNPGSFTGYDGTIFCGGLIGVYNINEDNQLWLLEDAQCATPEIAYDNITREVTITSSTEDAIFYYTTDGSTTPDPENFGGDNPTQLYDPTNKPTISATTTFKAIAVKTNMVDSEVATQTIEKLINPSVSFDDATQKVNITTNSAVEGATSVYTTDGNNPTPSSDEYSEPISLTATTTVKAMTVKDGYINSDPISVTVTKLASTPSISVSSSTVTLSYSDPEATIHYVTDGTTPTLASSSYNNTPFSLVGNQKFTIKAIATKTGCLHSDVVEEVIDNRSTIIAPTISVDGNTVTITANDIGDEIYYTTDGTTPTTSTATHFTSSGSFNLENGSSYTVKAIASNGSISSSEATETVDLTVTGYAGIYYIQNNANSGAYYMYPVGSDDYVKTAKITDKDAIWKIEMVGDYYRIIHYEDGKYLVAADLVDGSMPDKKTVSLVTTDSPGESALFEITRKSGDESNILNQVILIRPKAATNTTNGNNIYLNPTGGNNGTNTIGLYNNTGSSEWKLATVPAKPTFSVSDINVTMSCDLGDIYYTIDGTTPTSSSTSGNSVTLAYGPTYTVKAISIYNDTKSGETWQSGVASKSVQVNLTAPAFSVSGNTVKLRSLQEGVSFRYTYDDAVTLTATTGEEYDNSTGINLTSGNVYTVRALAYNTVNSTPYVSTIITFEVDLREAVEITSLAGITSTTGNYKIKTGFTASGTPRVGGNGDEIGTESNPFQGTLDGDFVEIEVGSSPLFAYVQNATIKNIKITNSSVSTSGNAGAIANVAKGDSRIYNCGVLDGTVSGSTNVGSIVGLLDGTSRVINCYSFATVSGGTMAAGIVGNNNQSSTQSNIKTIVVNCMFYGDITGGSEKYPVYGGNSINNDDANDGINPYCYFRKNATFTPTAYNRSWPAEEKYLTRFEYYRSILNSNRRLCTWWVNGTDNYVPTDDDVETVGIAKWVLDPSIAPYPILKKWGKYPSLINPDQDKHVDPSTKQWTNRDDVHENWGEHMAPDTEGQILGSISVSIDGGAHHSGAKNKTISKTINITAMDTESFDYCYGKIQLPYYNEIFGDPEASTNEWDNRYGGNYKEYVVTGWEISVSGSKAAENYNFAERNSINGRIFAQGGYYYVPDGVTSITITAHWGKAVYLANRGHSIDRVNVTNAGYKQDSPFSPAGTVSNTFKPISTGAEYTVYNDLQEAIKALGTYNTNSAVYDQAIVLIGNHQVKNGSPNSTTSDQTDVSKALDGNWHPFTIMSADFDIDDEPDFCLQLQFRKDVDRPGIQPIRFDFLPVVELGLAVRHDNKAYAIGIMVPQGHFEITETAFMHTTQFEYDGFNKSPSNSRIETKSPVIINGGDHEMFTVRYHDSDRTSYFLIGGNAWIHRFAPGSHPHTSASPKIYMCPINVIGGEVKELYLSGLYKPNLAVPANQGNPFCYIDGGKFETVAGAGYDKVVGNVTFKIDHTLIGEFYGGGINGSNPIGGNIDVTINNSRVDKYCGGPVVGDMSGKTVTTRATGTTFGVFYGGGNGGNSYYRQLQKDGDMPSTHIGTWNDNDYHWNIFNPLGVIDDDINAENKGYHAEYEFEVFNQSNGVTDQITQRGFIRWIQFGITITGNVSNTLSDCKILNNFYGGGNLATVDGTVTSTLTNTEVDGSVFGAGFSATIPKFSVHDKSTVSFPTITAGVITDGSIDYKKDDNGDVIEYEWTNDLNGLTEAQRKANPVYKKDGKWYCYTWNPLTNLGAVTGNATLSIEGTTTVAGSVYGGGEESGVSGDTEVNVSGGTIGIANAPAYGALVGNVYGGGKGDTDNVTAGLVKGNTEVNISQAEGKTTMIYHNIYGGGAYGSVGTYTYDGSGNITGYTSGGTANVTITGGTIGTTGKENGMVFGSSRGDVDRPLAIQDRLAWVHDTHVTIGTPGQGSVTTTPLIKGSIYGSGENGHTYQNTVVDVHSGKIGINDNNDPDGGATYRYRGNVYGGGCGTDKYYNDPTGITDPYDGNGDTYNSLAGIVLGNATVNIDGGLVVRNVYGAGAMGSVGDADKRAADATASGKATINISGGTIGVSGTVGDGNVFGAARGDINDQTAGLSQIWESDVNISSNANIYGSVYGGGEAGLVKEITDVSVTGGTINKNVYGGGDLGDVGTYTTDANDANIYPEGSGICNVSITGGTIGVDGNGNGNVFGAGKGDAGTFKCMKAMVYKTNVAVSNGTVWGNVYGGGEIGRVENDTKVEIGTEDEITDTSKPDIKGSVFGAGKGLDTHGYSALVRGNPVVTVQGSAKVGRNVYGGGEIASVGKHSLVTDGNKDQHPELEVGMPFTLANNSVGVCTVTVKDKAEITGNVFGAGKGVKPAEVANPGRMTPTGEMESYDPASNAFHIYVQTLALVTDTHVSIGGTATGTATKVLGSVYGGSESGFVQYNTNVAINQNCTIGTSSVEGNVYGGGLGIAGNDVAGRVGGNTKIDINNGTTHGSVFGGGAYGVVKGSVNVNINDGIIDKDVYGGGALAHTNTGMWDDAHNALLEYAEVKNLIVDSSPVTGYFTRTGTEGNYTYSEITAANTTAASETTYYAKYTTTVNLTGGKLRNAYGGGLGVHDIGEDGQTGYIEGTPAYVYGDVMVKLNEGVTSANASTTKGCIVEKVFGCNNLKGTPKGHVQVHVYATQNANTGTYPHITPKHAYHTTDAGNLPETGSTSTYDVLAVYGGGNLAPFDPVDAYSTDASKKAAARCEVIIDGCGLTSIRQVYAGGNAAPAPATLVQVHGTYEIEEVFGGGNGKDDYTVNNGTTDEWFKNPGANVGYRNYTHLVGGESGGDGTSAHPYVCAENSDALTKEARQTATLGDGSLKYMYGSGVATTEIYGGKIHYVYGGSNEKGNISIEAMSIYEEESGAGSCDMDLDQTYGGGKNSEIDGTINMGLGCVQNMKETFGGSKNADVNSDIVLNITNGTYERVFGGNNTSGNINGSITVNIYEDGCSPVRIGELYLGGYLAGYSIYGYKADRSVRTKAEYDALSTAEKAAITVRKDPRINIISATRIDKVFGGGYEATVVGNPHVNVNMEKGKIKAEYVDENFTNEHSNSKPYYTWTGESVDATSGDGILPIGTIGTIYGGGNKADIYGNTFVEIGTGQWLDWDDSGNEIWKCKDASDGKTYTYKVKTPASGTTPAVWAWYDGTTEQATNFAPTPARKAATITGNVYGGGKGETDHFECKKAMVGIDNESEDETKRDGGTSVIIANGTVGSLDENDILVEGTGNVYGGGEIGRVEKNTMVTIGLGSGTEGGTKTPVVYGNVFGAGSGKNTHGYSALVRGNSTVTVQGNAWVQKSVYGGGEIASVGKYAVNDAGIPTIPVRGGICTVTVKGWAEIGPDNMQMTKAGGPDDTGYVFGACKGTLPYEGYDDDDPPYHLDGDRQDDGSWTDHPRSYTAFDNLTLDENNVLQVDEDYMTFINTLALATSTEVTIGEHAFVKGAIYGGSENGHVQSNTHVTIQDYCQIGNGEGKNRRYTETEWTNANPSDFTECAHWPYGDENHDGPYNPYDVYKDTNSDGTPDYATDGHTFYGNVFGGGSGYYPYHRNDPVALTALRTIDSEYADGLWHREAGSVGGNTVVDITGGHILTNVYGGNEHTDVTGTCTINMSGGTVGVPRTEAQAKAHPVTCYIFGAGKGDQRINFNNWTNVASTQVNISGTARIFGSTFGGGEDGHVLGNVETNINAGSNVSVGVKTIQHPYIGTTGTSGVDGNIFGGGRGFSETALTAGVVGGNVTVNIHGGTMLGSVFGGGRLASVGTYFANVESENYGKLQPDVTTQAATTYTAEEAAAYNEENSLTEGEPGYVSEGDEKTPAVVDTHGTISINIDGGTIGATDAETGELLTSTSSIGDVFGGCKGSGNNKHFGLAKKTIINMSGGTVNGNVYGGGELGYVGEATLNSSNVYVWNEESAGGGLCTVGISGGTVKGNVFGAGKGKDDDFDCEKALVRATSVTISKSGTTGTTVGGNVYGGGEIGRVDQSTMVTIGNKGTNEGAGEFGGTDALITGSVFGAGAGVETHGYSALVRGNSEVTVQGNAKVGNSVYGGGMIASVGQYGLDSNFMPETLKGDGECTVTVKGYAEIGSLGEGHVFGAGMGVNPFDAAHNYINYTNNSEDPNNKKKKPKRMTKRPADDKMPTLWDPVGDGSTYIWEYYTSQEKYFNFLQTLALATDTYVTIDGNASVHGSVFGGSESGFVQKETDVKIQGSSKILTITDTNDNPIEGNVFGGGKGVPGFENAGRVRGNTKTAISGGTINGNVYGGGELGHVGKFTETSDGRYVMQTIQDKNNKTINTGLCTVSVTGGKIGPNNNTDKDKGNVFGAGKGKDDTFKCEKAMAMNTSVSVSGGTVNGNVYGGGEIGRVEYDTEVQIGSGDGTGGTSSPTINGSVYGAGRGVVTHGYSALVRKDTKVTIEGDAYVGHSAFGGGEIASVGRYGLDAQKMPSILLGHTGYCTVKVQGHAVIGPMNSADEEGNVYGAGKGIDPQTFNNDAANHAERSRRMTIYNATDFPDNAKLTAAGYTGNGTKWEFAESYSNEEIADNNKLKFVWEYYQTIGDYTTYLETLALATHPDVTIDGNATVNGSVFGGGEQGLTKGSVVVKINDGTIVKDVYGGGALANTNTTSSIGLLNEDGSAVTVDGQIQLDEDIHPTTTVTLHGGVIGRSVYGGGLGQLYKAAVAAQPAQGTEGQEGYVPAVAAQAEVPAIEAKVFGTVLVTLNGVKQAASDDTGDAATYYDCEVKGYIFGCNNRNGSPQRSVTVHVFNTVRKNESGTVVGKPEKKSGVYELKAVYGGGNLAAFKPDLEATADTAKTYVIIDGCELTSIKQVYGGGNAASAPATNVTVNGTYEIDEVFGGGNGADPYTIDGDTYENPGANVGYDSYAYHTWNATEGKFLVSEYGPSDGSTKDASTKEMRLANYQYGSGETHVNIYGGTVHAVYGGSNSKGNVRVASVALLDGEMVAEGTEGYCEFNVDEAYGGGKNADMDGTATLIMSCIEGLKEVYGGAEDADVLDNITLNITNGTFDKVFGGNNIGGRVMGSITVNVEETGCKPIIIGELYGGGNEAPYSVYGYKMGDDGKWKALKVGEDGASANPCASPQVNVKSFTGIGNIFGGGYGEGAVMVADPTVNINVVKGRYAGETSAERFTNARGGYTADDDNKRWYKTIGGNTIYVPQHEAGKIGGIYNVFGGGNAAAVIGTPHVNVGTLTGEVITLASKKIEDSEGKAPTDEGWIPSYELTTAEGVDIRGNVYGAGNNAPVTGDTEVVIGKNNDVKTYIFKSFSEETGGTAWSSGLAQTTGVTKGGNAEVVILSNGKYTNFVGQKYYVAPDATTNGSTRTALKDASGNTTGLWVAISEHKIYNFTSYGASTGGTQYSTGTAAPTGNFKTIGGQEHMQIQVLTNPGETSWVGKTFYVPVSAKTDGTERTQLLKADETAVGVWVTITE